MSLTTFILWVVFALSVLALVFLQVRSILAAKRLGGKSARTVVRMRSAITVVLLGLFGYVVYVQATQ